MKITCISVFFLLLSSSIHANERFNYPKAGGVALDWCLTWAKGCGKPAADYYCRKKGYSGSVRSGKAQDVGYTKILKTGKICNQPMCDSFSYIECKSTKRFNYPKAGGVALDWCLTWAKGCGKPAADYYCRKKGYSGSIRSGKAQDVGYTKILKTGKICNQPMCDSFSYIECTR